MSYTPLNYEVNEILINKKDNMHLLILTTNFKCLDISNYLIDGCSYSKFLKAYGYAVPKEIFQYAWFDQEDELHATTRRFLLKTH